MAKIYYVDTAIPSDRKKRGRHKTHVVFDGDRTFKVNKLTELEDAGEIYIDALFPELYDEILELLKRDVRVYLLKDPIKLKKLRVKNNMKKSDENDAVLLARIPKEKFRPLTVKEVEFKARIRPLISKYERLVRWKMRLKRLIRDGFDYNFRESINLMEADRRKVSEEIIRQVASLPVYGEVYRKACEMLGIKNSVELAILTLELPLHFPLCDLKGLVGLNPNKTMGQYDRRLNRHIAALAAALYLNIKVNKKYGNVPAEVIEMVNRLPSGIATDKLRLTALKTLRIAYLMTVKPLKQPLAGG